MATSPIFTKPKIKHMQHKLIKTENYLLVVDDSGIKAGDWCLDLGTNKIFKAGLSVGDEYKELFKKIIAHLPLNNSPLLEGVPLLPPLEDEIEKLAKEEILYNDQKRAWWKQGYNKAKEKYKYTEEDLFMLAAKVVNDIAKNRYNTHWNMFTTPKMIAEEFIQQPKMPVGFESEDEVYMHSINGDTMKPKTITNSQGQTQLVGTYIYE
jgi:hypothetical protein